MQTQTQREGRRRRREHRGDRAPKAWVAYKIAKIGKRLGTVYGETEKEALANAQKLA
jgi:hypothetical protein